MKIEQLPLAKLQPYANNSRTHSAAQIEQIAASMREFGFTNPVLIDASGGIIAGHGRVQAAAMLKLTKVPCLRLSHLSEAQKRAYVIADNKIAEGGGWDQAMLAMEIQGLIDSGFDTAPLAFSDDEIDELLGGYTGAHDDGVLDAHATTVTDEDGPAEVEETGGRKPQPPAKTGYPVILYLSKGQYQAWRAHLAATDHHDGARALIELIDVTHGGAQ